MYFQITRWIEARTGRIPDWFLERNDIEKMRFIPIFSKEDIISVLEKDPCLVWTEGFELERAKKILCHYFLISFMKEKPFETSVNRELFFSSWTRSELERLKNEIDEIVWKTDEITRELRDLNQAIPKQKTKVRQAAELRGKPFKRVKLRELVELYRLKDEIEELSNEQRKQKRLLKDKLRNIELLRREKI